MKFQEYPAENLTAPKPVGKDFELEIEEMSIYEMVKRKAAQYPEAPAFEYMGTWGTFSQLIEKFDEAAQAFVAAGIRKGDIVTIAMPNTPEAVFSIYALNKIGAVANVIHPLSGETQIMNYITSVNSKIVVAIDICTEKLKNIIDKTQVEKVVLVSASDSFPTLLKIGYKLTQKQPEMPSDSRFTTWKKFIESGKSAGTAAFAEASPFDPAVILHSGGTTGTPKEIVLTSHGFNSLAHQAIMVLYDIRPNDKVLAILPVFHSFGLGVCVHITFCLGACSVLIPRFEAKKFTKLMAKYKPAMVFGVPTLYEALMNSPGADKLDLSHLKYMVSGGDSLSETLEKRLNNFLKKQNASITVTQGYGLTECLGAVCLAVRESYKPGSIGAPLPGNKFIICTPGTQDELPPNTEGEICLYSPAIMLGYRNNEKETNEVLQMHKDGRIWLHTGDIGTIDEDGCIFYRLRLKRLIISSGYNVYPQHIENIIEQHEAVLKCTVIGIPHPYKIEVAKAYVVLKQGYEETDALKAELKEHCKKNLAHYSVPYEFEFRNSIPTTLLGKTDFTQLKKEHLAGTTNGENIKNGKNITGINKSEGNKEEERSGDDGVQNSHTCA